MGIRQRKNHLILVLAAHVKGGALTAEQAQTFEGMYRAAKTQDEQDQVTAAVKVQMDGWKTEPDRHSRVLRDVFEMESRFADEDLDDDPPALKAALARSQVSFLRK